MGQIIEIKSVKILCLLFGVVLSDGCTQKDSRCIDLAPNTPQGVTVVGGEHLIFRLLTVPVNASFVIFQAHTQYRDLIVSRTKESEHGQSVRGNDLGVVSVIGQDDHMVWYVNSTCHTDISAVVIAQTYGPLAPMPGGCNLEFPLENDPNIQLKYTSYQSFVHFQLADFGFLPHKYEDHCEQTKTYANRLQYEVYQLFMKEGDLTEMEFMATVKQMLTPRSVQKYAKKVATIQYGKDKTEVSFASFPGQGALYTVLAREKDHHDQIHYSAYVPVTSYACRMHMNEQKKVCVSDKDSGLQVVATLLGAVGLFMAFFGHRFFKCATFAFGFLTFGMLAFILTARFTDLDQGVRLSVTLIVGTLGGAVWLLFWCMVGIPVLIILLPGLLLGFLFSSFLFTLSPLGIMTIFRVDLNYGMAFACGVLLIPIFLLIFTKQLSILSCAILGSYGFFCAIDSFLPTNFGRIVGISMTKAFVPGFVPSIARIPFQQNDIILVVFWVILAVLGIIFQIWREKGRPAFPPHPYGQYRLRQQSQTLAPVNRYFIYGEDDEQRPLLGDSRGGPVAPQPRYLQGPSAPPAEESGAEI